jgi:hypothetical protein
MLRHFPQAIKAGRVPLKVSALKASISLLELSFMDLFRPFASCFTPTCWSFLFATSAYSFYVTFDPGEPSVSESREFDRILVMTTAFEALSFDILMTFVVPDLNIYAGSIFRVNVCTRPIRVCKNVKCFNAKLSVVFFEEIYGSSCVLIS